jgi:hypothetical protein
MRAQNSRMAKMISSMYDDGPEEQDLDVTKDVMGMKKAAEEEEITRYEEQYFTRLERKGQRKEKEKAKKRRDPSEMDDILGGLEDFATFKAIERVGVDTEDKFTKNFRKRTRENDDEDGGMSQSGGDTRKRSNNSNPAKRRKLQKKKTK